jgi:hypothetical protein
MVSNMSPKKIIGLVVFLIAVLILVLMYMNGMDFQATVSQITGWFG